MGRFIIILIALLIIFDLTLNDRAELKWVVRYAMRASKAVAFKQKGLARSTAYQTQY
jgi:hypothetical protein